MSDIKIQPSATGSGTVTITAPTTNTARVITLPDSAGTLLDENSSVPSANLTGTVVDARISALTASKLTGALPAISGANLTSVNAVNSGRKNMIINGDMMIDQRNAGASATTTASVYMADRFQLYASTINNAQTYQQVAEAPAGFNKSLKITNSSTAQAAGSNALFTPRQRIEGYNIAHLNWGTSDAQTVTISFWVKASVTGTYPLAINNGNFDRSFVTNYTVSVANTWEKKTATIAGDTSGTWAVDNTTSMIIMFSLDTNTTYQTSTVDAWQATAARGTSSDVHFLATASATWQITGIQMETGSVATDFEYRSYGEELALCQRYFEKLGRGGGYAGDRAYNHSSRIVNLPTWATTKRADPTVTIYSYDGTANAMSGYSSGTNNTVTSLSDPNQYALGRFITLASAITQPHIGYFHADSEL